MASSKLPWIISLLIASQSACSIFTVAGTPFVEPSRTQQRLCHHRHRGGHHQGRGRDCRGLTGMMMVGVNENFATSSRQRNIHSGRSVMQQSAMAFVLPSARIPATSLMTGGQISGRSSSSPQHYHHTTTISKPSITSTSLFMSLVPIPISTLSSILPTPTSLTPTGDQYVTYLGRTPKQRYESLFEGASIAFLGSMFAYFVSFVVGQFLATCLGVVFLFWPILSPEFKAYQRNWELVGGRDLVDVWMDDDDLDGNYWRGIPEDKRGLYGAYYVTKIQDVCVVDDVRAPSDEEYDLEEFEGYTMATDELESVTGLPWKLRLRLLDEEGRGMQVHSRLSEEYLDLQPGMDAVGVLLSTSKEFGELAGMTDFCVLDSNVEGIEDYGPEVVAWVGDYPYLDKDVFMRTLGENGVMDSLLEFEEDGDEDFDDEKEEDGLEENGGIEEEEVGETEEYINVR